MAKQMKNNAVHGKFIIERAENNSITVRFRNTKEALCEMADKVGMEYKKDWVTQYLGNRLIKFLNNETLTANEVAETSGEIAEAKSNDNTSYLSDEAWEWWCGLSDSAKYTLIDNANWFYGEKIRALPVLEDGKIRTSWDLYDRNGPIRNYVSYYTGYYENGQFNKAKTDKIEWDKEYDASVIGELGYLCQAGHLSSFTSNGRTSWNYAPIPAGISELKSLKKLGLGYRDLSEAQEELENILTAFSELEELNLSSNRFNTLPTSLAKLTQLKKLELNSSEFSDRIDHFPALTNLDELNLSSADLEHIPNLNECVQLKKLDLSLNEFKDKETLTLPHLEELNLSNSELSKMPNLSGCVQLKELNLSHNKFKDEGFESLVLLTNLEDLDLGYLGLKEIPSAISELKKLTRLYLAGNNDILPSELTKLASLTHLRTIYLPRENINMESEEFIKLHEKLPNCNIYFE